MYTAAIYLFSSVSPKAGKQGAAPPFTRFFLSYGEDNFFFFPKDLELLDTSATSRN